MADNKPGYLESGLRGAGQGVSLGLSDEGAGIGAALLSLVGLRPDKKGTAFDWEEAKKEYRSMRDSERNANSVARRENPGTYTASELISSLIAPTPFKGGSVAKTGIGRIAQAAGRAGSTGAASGFGHSEGDAKQQLIDTLISAGESGLGGGVLGGGGELSRKIGLSGNLGFKPVQNGIPGMVQDKAGKFVNAIPVDKNPYAYLDKATEMLKEPGAKLTSRLLAGGAAGLASGNPYLAAAAAGAVPYAPQVLKLASKTGGLLLENANSPILANFVGGNAGRGVGGRVEIRRKEAEDKTNAAQADIDLGKFAPPEDSKKKEPEGSLDDYAPKE